LFTVEIKVPLSLVYMGVWLIFIGLYLQLDVVVIDLDGGSVHIPECITLPTIPEPILGRTMKALHMVNISNVLVGSKTIFM